MSTAQNISTVERIKAEILDLSPQEFGQLTDWLLALDAERWDKQIEEDVKAGRLDALAEKALLEHKSEGDSLHPLAKCIGTMGDEEAAEMLKIIAEERERHRPRW